MRNSVKKKDFVVWEPVSSQRVSGLCTIKTHHYIISGKTIFRYAAGKIWNALPVSLRSAEDLLSVKKVVNMHLREELITEARGDFHFY